MNNTSTSDIIARYNDLLFRVTKLNIYIFIYIYVYMYIINHIINLLRCREINIFDSKFRKEFNCFDIEIKIRTF